MKIYDKIVANTHSYEK